MKMRVACGVLAAALVALSACNKQPAPAADETKPLSAAPLAPAAAAQTPETPNAVRPEPIIELSTTHYDMGTVPNDKPTKGTVTIRNKGNAPLVLSQVNTSCGCTMGSIEESDKLVQPGGEVPLTIVVTPAKISGFESTKVLTIFSNDPKRKHVELEVKLKIEAEFAVEPSLLAFDKIQKGEIGKKQLIIRQTMDEPFKEKPFEVTVARLLGSPPGLTANLALRPEAEWASPGKREYVVDVALDTNQVPPGPYQGMLDLETSVTRVRHMVVNVTADVLAPYRVSPRPASFGLVQPGKALAGTVTVAADQAVEVSNVAISGEDLSAKQVPGPDEKTALIQLSVSPTAQGGAKREKLSFTVKSGDVVFNEQVQVIVVVAHPTPPPSTTRRHVGAATGPAVSQ